MLAKMARSAPRSPFGVPGMTAVVRAAKRSCQNAAKAQKSTTVRGIWRIPGQYAGGRKVKAAAATLHRVRSGPPGR